MDYEALAKQFGGVVVPGETAFDILGGRNQTQGGQAAPVDLSALAAQYGGTVEVPSTTATGLAGAATRGLAFQPLGRLLALLWALHLLVLVRYQALLQAQALQPLRGWLVTQLSACSIGFLEQNTHCQQTQWNTFLQRLV